VTDARGNIHDTGNTDGLPADQILDPAERHSHLAQSVLLQGEPFAARIRPQFQEEKEQSARQNHEARRHRPGTHGGIRLPDQSQETFGPANGGQLTRDQQHADSGRNGKGSDYYDGNPIERVYHCACPRTIKSSMATSMRRIVSPASSTAHRTAFRMRSANSSKSAASGYAAITCTSQVRPLAQRVTAAPRIVWPGP